jgi:hypothetical protein
MMGGARGARARSRATALAVLALAAGCGSQDGEAVGSVAATPQGAFWANLQGLCESSHEGVLLRAPEGDTQVPPEARLVVHFWECGKDRLRFPFHVGDNHSRTWFFIRHDDRIELRHDHRNPDGTEEATTWYGAFTGDGGTDTRQEFTTERSGIVSGWRVEIVPGERYTYGTIRNGEWRHHLDFDLTREVDPLPLPWGHEVLPSGLDR